MSESTETWAKVELMGHVCLWGRLTEEEKFGGKIGRLDVPTMTQCPLSTSESHSIAPDDCPQCHGKYAVDGFATQYFGGGSVYRITLVSEKVARDQAKKSGAAPVSSWDYPKPALSYNREEIPEGDQYRDPEDDEDVDADEDAAY